MKPSTTLLYASSILFAPVLHAYATLDIKLPAEWAPNAKMIMFHDDGSTADITTTNEENNPARCYATPDLDVDEKMERCEDDLPRHKFLCPPIHFEPQSTKRFVISLPGYELDVSQAARH